MTVGDIVNAIGWPAFIALTCAFIGGGVSFLRLVFGDD
jgi:hypothetical protein